MGMNVCLSKSKTSKNRGEIDDAYNFLGMLYV